ncbi:tetraspanin-13a [Boleophthalmus pectinirostris]|uniref:tetraspanin-13a n=1 Tax=Boleophthalmus pectinirostris TaxID=150288 RepID=UPI00242C3258|nr:tetraspanin-13a [Boleophthalmus pectinirostris]
MPDGGWRRRLAGHPSAPTNPRMPPVTDRPLLPQLVSVLLVGVASWGRLFALVSSVQVVGGVVGVGCFLFLVALMGLCGALRQNQILLFFYMIILFMVFVMQFSVSCACLTLNKQQQDHLLEVGWNRSEATQRDVERTLNCCGFTHINNSTCTASCLKEALSCQPCADIITAYTGDILRFVGGIGLFFSFTEILGVWLAYRYRNLKDPRKPPGAFL